MSPYKINLFHKALLSKQALRYLAFFSSIAMRFSSGKRVTHQRRIAKYFAEIHTMKMAIITSLEGLRIFMSKTLSLANRSYSKKHTKTQSQKDKFVFFTNIPYVFVFNFVWCIKYKIKNWKSLKQYLGIQKTVKTLYFLAFSKKDWI